MHAAGQSDSHACPVSIEHNTSAISICVVKPGIYDLELIQKGNFYIYRCRSCALLKKFYILGVYILW